MSYLLSLNGMAAVFQLY